MNIPLPEVEEISEQPINQWHAQILEQANSAPISHRNWETQSRTSAPVKMHEWPRHTTR